MHFDPGKLRLLRQRKGKTIADVADHLRISSAQVHRLEKGQRRLTIETLGQYCEALNIDLGQLFEVQSRVASEMASGFEELWGEFDRKRTRQLLHEALKRV